MNKKNELIDKNKPALKKEIGLVAATAIVVGNIIGSGIIMAPQSLAVASNPKATIIAWAITALGSILVALSFARLGQKMPETGGPIVYSKAAFGDFVGFLIAWTYWIAGWVGNAALITASLNYLVYFIPAIGSSKFMAFLLASIIVWTLTLINIKGAKETGILSIITTICKIIPLIVFIVIASLHFNPDNFNTISSTKVSGMGSLPAAIAITLWAFVGLEGATVAGGNIRNPEKNIPRSTVIGIFFSAIIYCLISILAMGAMSQGNLANSSAPLADIINKATGAHFGGALIAAGAIVSTLGAALGWQLVISRGAMAAGQDKLFPAVFGKINSKTNTPVSALIIDAVLINIMLLLNYVQSLQSAYNFLILLSTLAILPAYTFCSAGEMVLIRKKIKNFNIFSFIKNTFLSLLAFAYTIYAIYGTGSKVVMYGFLLMLTGIPFYLYIKLKDLHNEELKDSKQKKCSKII